MEASIPVTEITGMGFARPTQALGDGDTENQDKTNAGKERQRNEVFGHGG